MNIEKTTPLIIEENSIKSKIFPKHKEFTNLYFSCFIANED